MSKINFFLVDEDNEGRRLDNFLFSNFKKSIPKSKIYSSIRKAKIKVNGKKSKPDYKLFTVIKGDTLYSIARQFGSDVQTIARQNNMSLSTILLTGMKLRVPTSQIHFD